MRPSLAEDISSLLLCPLHHSQDDFSLRGKIEILKKDLRREVEMGKLYADCPESGQRVAAKIIYGCSDNIVEYYQSARRERL